MSTAFRIGALVVLGLLFLSIGIFLIGDKELLFGSSYKLKAGFQNVRGLNNGAEVRVGGIHEGTVKEIDLPPDPNGKVVVVMSLRRSTRGTVRKDSVASIKTEGLLGDQYVEISFGSPKSGAVENGDTIGSEVPKDMSDELHAVADEAKAGGAAFRDDMQALQHNFLLRGFFARRGYHESSELTQHSIARLPSATPVKRFDYDAGQLFDKPDSAKLKNKKKLDDTGRYLEGNEFDLAVIAASETKGDTDKDRVLTQARAKVVRDYLVQNFKFDDTRLKTLGRGKSGNSGETAELGILVYPRRLAQAAQGSLQSDP